MKRTTAPRALASSRAELMLALGLTPRDIAQAMTTALARRTAVIAAIVGRRERTLSARENAEDINTGDREHDQPSGLTNPLLDLILAVAASIQQGTPREAALAPLDLAERVFGRLAVDEPVWDGSDRPGPAGTAAALMCSTAEALEHVGDYTRRLGGLLADGSLTPDELSPARVAHLRGLARAAAAQLLEAQRVLDTLEVAGIAARQDAGRDARRGGVA